MGRLGMKKSKAVVAITARMIDVDTGEVLASESGRGVEPARDKLLGGGAAKAAWVRVAVYEQLGLRSKRSW